MATKRSPGDVAGDPRLSALVDAAKPAVFWSDRDDAPSFGGRLSGHSTAELVIIGGGYTGLWAALAAVEENPGRRVVLLEAESIGHGASSRNGGFCDASLTHGLENGVAHWPDETETLIRLGDENLAGLLSDLDRLGVDCSQYRADTLWTAVTQWQMDDLVETAELFRRFDRPATLLDRTETNQRLSSPTFFGGLLMNGSLALVQPAQLAWGLGDAAQRLGVDVHEQSAVTGLSDDRGAVLVSTAGGSIRADRVITATNAWAGPGKAMRRRMVPVYDHVLMTEPLSEAQMNAIGWQGREGVSDSGNQFHYYRLSDDNRILWGGYDANYYYGSRVEDRHEDRRQSFELLASHFFETFPQLEGLGFSHRWAGPIATTARFTAAWGKEFDGRAVWVGGYTGLGVGASRFGARVALDLVDGVESERTELEMVRSASFPFPPEPLRWPAFQLTRRAIVRSDRRDGKRGPWLSLLDRFGVGFNS